jgi:hypothetical protein
MYDMQAYFEVQAARREIAGLKTDIGELKKMLKDEQQKTRELILEALQVQSE